MTPASVRALRPTAQAWFAFAGGLSAYALHLVVTFWLLAADCPPGTGVVVVVATVLAVAVAAAAVEAGRRLRREHAAAADRGSAPRATGAPPDRPGGRSRGRGLLLVLAGVAARERRRVQGEQEPPVSSGWDTVRGEEWRPFLATVGIVLSGLSLVIVVLSAVAAVLLPVCGG